MRPQRPRRVFRRPARAVRALAPRRWDELLKRIPLDQPFRLAEIGVWKGQTAQRLLAERPLLTLYLIDPWAPGDPGSSWCASGAKDAQTSQADMDAMCADVRRLVARYGARAVIIREPSLSAAARFESGSLDGVFIDADHSYLGVYSDIDAWKSKVRAGGFLSGHDYGSPRFPGVARAVHDVLGAGAVTRGSNSTWFVRV